MLEPSERLTTIFMTRFVRLGFLCSCHAIGRGEWSLQLQHDTLAAESALSTAEKSRCNCMDRAMIQYCPVISYCTTVLYCRSRCLRLQYSAVELSDCVHLRRSCKPLMLYTVP